MDSPSLCKPCQPELTDIGPETHNIHMFCLFFQYLRGFKRAHLLLYLAISGCVGGCATPKISDTSMPAGEAMSYLGIQVGFDDEATGARIDRLWPGPVLKALQTQLDIDIRRDRLIAIDSIPVTADNFYTVVENTWPGTRIELLFSDPTDPEAESKALFVTVGRRQDWTGPITRYDAASFANRPQALPIQTEHDMVARLVRRTVTEQQLSGPVANLHRLFVDWQREQRGYHTLGRVLYPFQHPYQLAALETEISSPFLNLEPEQQQIFGEIARNLDLTEPVSSECDGIPTLDALMLATTQAQQQLQLAFAGFDSKGIAAANLGLQYLLQQLSEKKTLVQQLEPDRSILAINSSMSIDYDALLASASAYRCVITNREALVEEQVTLQPPPPELANIVSGDIVKAIPSEYGWIIHGGPGDNSYELRDIAAVYDPAGNDRYHTTAVEPMTAKLVWDQSGNDRYFGETSGPGAAWMGVSILIDNAGDDIYSGELAVNASGIMGIGILLDRGGDDVYAGQYFSNGAAFYGAGILLDQGTGDDSYRSTAFSQGFGGPKGFGVINDNGGDDSYLANYGLPSVYGTENVFAAFSQGFGFGLRHFDSGGIGLIVDKQGNDHYDAGEFSQGGAYYWGLGLLHDADGNDVYQGNRYSQGFGVHQASGVLRDDAGDDHYLGMTAACQGAAWDVALGLLVDAAGNDHYSGDGLCQGAAAMQAQAWLIDLSGKDTYEANGKSIQGSSGRNSYHFNVEKPVYSWSVLVDGGAGEDYFSSGHAMHEVTSNSYFDELEPGDSRAYGLFIDLPETLSVDSNSPPLSNGFIEADTSRD